MAQKIEEMVDDEELKKVLKSDESPEVKVKAIEYLKETKTQAYKNERQKIWGRVAKVWVVFGCACGIMGMITGIVLELNKNKLEHAVKAQNEKR